jgi:hypothetical protein
MVGHVWTSSRGLELRLENFNGQCWKRNTPSFHKMYVVNYSHQTLLWQVFNFIMYFKVCVMCMKIWAIRFFTLKYFKQSIANWHKLFICQWNISSQTNVNGYKPITNTAWVRALLCKLQKGCTRLTAASDKVYPLLAHGRWIFPDIPASSRVECPLFVFYKAGHEPTPYWW